MVLKYFITDGGECYENRSNSEFIECRKEGGGYMIKNEWYNLTADELREVVNSPKNSGIKGSILTFIVVMVNVLPLFFKFPVKFTKTYIHVVLRNFIQR